MESAEGINTTESAQSKTNRVEPTRNELLTF